LHFDLQLFLFLHYCFDFFLFIINLFLDSFLLNFFGFNPLSLYFFLSFNLHLSLFHLPYLLHFFLLLSFNQVLDHLLLLLDFLIFSPFLLFSLPCKLFSFLLQFFFKLSFFLNCFLSFHLFLPRLFINLLFKSKFVLLCVSLCFLELCFILMIQKKFGWLSVNYCVSNLLGRKVD